jgi:putative hydrolase of the HAD superfamily
MKVKVKAVIFDFGHVLSLPPRPEEAAWLRESCGLAAEEYARAFHELRPELDRGTMPITEYWGLMLRRGGRTGSPELLASLAEHDLASWTHPNRPVLRWAEELRRGGWLTAILSNMPPEFVPFLTEHFPEISRFCPAVFSCQEGLIKPEPDIFLRCLRRLGLGAREVLFLDDMAVNVESAKRLGLYAVQFRSLEECARELEASFELPLPESGRPLGRPAEVTG